MKLVEGRYINEAFHKYENGIYIVEADQGSGKTERLLDLYDKQILMMGARNTLGESTLDRLGFIDSTHLKDNGYTYSADELQQFQNLWINIASGKKLTLPQVKSSTPEYFIVDEALLNSLFIHTSSLVPYAAYLEFLARLIHTPKVILMGATFPYFIRKKLKALAKYRADKNYQHIKYKSNFLEGTSIQYVSSCKEMDSEIVRVMDKRMAGKGNRFLFKDMVATDTDHKYSPAYLKGERYPKGVLIVSERGESVENVKAKWQEHYPEANIICAWSGSDQDFTETLKELGDPNKATDVDMIISSPVWGTGINIRHFAEITVGDYGFVPNAIHTDEDIKQGMCRDRDCKSWIIWPRKTDNSKTKKALVGDLNKEEDLMKHLNFFGLKKEEFYERDPYTNSSLPRDIEFLKDSIRVNVWVHNHKLGRWSKFDKWAISRGAVINTDYEAALEKHLPKNHFKKKWEQAAYVEKAIAGANKPIEDWTEKEKYIYQYKHKAKDRLKTRKDLENKQWLSEDKTLTSTQNDFYIHKLVEETRELFMKLTEEQNIVWLEIFLQSKQWSKIFANRHRINKIIQSKGWHFTIKNQVELDPLNALKDILQEFNYYVEVTAGVSKTRKGLQAKAKKDNLTEFNKWKKLQNKSHLRVNDYLFDGLANGKIELNTLSITTRKYLQEFPHIVIENV